MTYQVLARKWRPQMFEAVVGQEAITRTLRNALVSGRIAHAYLFAGPRGIGKTTTARLLARALLCPERREAEPCGACPVCVEAQAGAAVDLIEVDGASNRGIDEIRTLRENVKYAPARGRYKVYIIDEVHQLTGPAFDAFLKTLEEPPAHVVFILATTDPRELPPTILSRVQRFDFRPIPPDLLVATLERVLREEKVDFEPGALPVIVRAAEGSLRDALSLLDTAIAYGSGRLDAETVSTLLGTTAPAAVRAFVEALLAHDAAGALEAVDRTVADGDDLEAFVRDVVELLRQTLVLKAAPTAKLADLGHAEANAIRRLGDAVSVDEILYVMRGFMDAATLMKESPHPRVEVEVATVRATRRPVPQAIEALLRRVDEVEARLRRQGPPSAPNPATQEPLLGYGEAPGSARAPEPRRGGAPSAGLSGSSAPAPAARPPASGRSRAPEPSPPIASPGGLGSPAGPPVPSAGAPVAAVGASASPADPAVLPAGSSPSSAVPPGGDLETAWQRVVEEVTRKKPMLGAILAQALPGPVAEGELTVTLTGNHFQRDQLADRVNRDVVLGAIRRNLRDVDRFRVTQGEADAGDMRQHPAVQAAIAEFGGEVVAVRPRPPEGEAQ
jgi:DNA polymerase-3 subunit gamma/tau